MRNVFKVDTGVLPRDKAEKYLKELIQKYRDPKHAFKMKLIRIFLPDYI